jgi:GTP:adenosylcobinamide-phosphate guanylyltransferase
MGDDPRGGPPPAFTALVLAGRRGAHDALAGHRHKALLPVAGVPMIVRVVRSLRAARCVGRILVSVDDAAVLEHPELRSLAEAGVLVRVPCDSSPSASVRRVRRERPAELPLLVTTADHALLTADMVEHFCREARARTADVVVGAVSAELLRAHYPDSPRTVIPLRDDGFSGANLFAFLTPQSTVAAEFWIRAEQFRKRPWRLVSVFGPLTLVAFLLRRLDLAAAAARVSRAMGATIGVVRMPFPECAIDVDRPADLALASRILEARQASAHAT